MKRAAGLVDDDVDDDNITYFIVTRGDFTSVC